MMKKLYVFSVRYPFTNNVECFLNEEMPYLARAFDMVVFVPLKIEVPKAKELPQNCSVTRPVFGNNLSFFFHGLFCIKSFSMIWKDFFQNGVWHDRKKLKVWLVGYFSINNILNSSIIKEVGLGLSSDDVCYFYWGKWSNILSCFWSKKAKCVSRFHGHGDLWEYDYNNYFPLRKKVTNSLMYAAHISSVGESYFKKKYPMSKTIISRLGSFDYGEKPASDVNLINIVSCSSLWPLKRVNLIMESVELLSYTIQKKIHWIHIGGVGEDLKKLTEAANQKRSKNLTISLMGSIPHDQVIEHYKTSPCDLFVNLSTSEGVPVSIMEAISFDIPIVATDVGGTSDVVAKDKSGQLVSPNPSAQEVADAMLFVLNNIDMYHPHRYWNEYFNADKNYTKFAEFLNSI